MKISVLAVGRLKSGGEQTQFNRYFDLFNASARGLKMPPMTVLEIGEGRSAAQVENADIFRLLILGGLHGRLQRGRHISFVERFDFDGFLIHQGFSNLLAAWAGERPRRRAEGSR